MSISAGEIIKKRRRELGLTQKQLACKLNISDKAISKWECNGGLPDISILPLLTLHLQIDIESLLNGHVPEEQNGGNMKNNKYYACPVCGNISVCTGAATVTCCGIKLDALEAVKADEKNCLTVEAVENEWYITSEHPMTKADYISFVVFATGEQLQLVRQFPEWNLSLRIPQRHGRLMWYSEKGGLLFKLI